MALSGSISIASNFTQSPANLPGSLPVRTQNTLIWTIATGTAVDLADQKFAVARNLVASTPWTINLLTDLVDFQGVAFVPARLKSITIRNKSAVAGQVVLFGFATTTSNALSGLISNPGQLTIRPSTAAGSPAVLALTAPDAAGYLIDATHKLLYLDSGANTIPIEVEIVCASA